MNITKDDVINEWVYCNYDVDDDSSITTYHLPEELIPNIIKYASDFIDNPKIIDQTELKIFLELSENDKKSVSICRGISKYVAFYNHSLDLVVDSVYDNIDKIFRRNRKL